MSRELIGRCANCDEPYIPERYFGGRDDPTVDRYEPTSCAECGGTTVTYTVVLGEAIPATPSTSSAKPKQTPTS